MDTPKKTRSRTGCFTCRKRKKKCDETSYPVCHNCQAKGLECNWPPLTHEIHKKIEQVKYVDQDRRGYKTIDREEEYKSLDEESDIIIEKSIRHDKEVVPRIHSGENIKISKPWKNNNKYYLQRIAMQQDIVDEQQPSAYDSKVPYNSETLTYSPTVDPGDSTLSPFIEDPFLDLNFNRMNDVTGTTPDI
ncbi:uncharacterized protein SPAPADRAFT_58370 [Spathaspora passalidarum NRRL Y-27907]|uniref:Zn(2)-C6 fungal-type domain-containing protein n=1 Tax=Spathaspora passalidarum (strain NRRL Y-27907 / 11-Y1) TaxID=619300 RepID=G3AG32_SPAPN|nr:uncharacterized protein SPAPADRAFT_58370 [Spathaspora passalidarum NRRL Y-27907]EGW35171.1 hypothetical protein SPAPADRAFT_58370 [Spathaspora passalidarum NRRL Y-27907]